MTGVRTEDFLSQGNLVIEGKAQQIVGTHMDFLLYGLPELHKFYMFSARF